MLVVQVEVNYDDRVIITRMPSGYFGEDSKYFVPATREPNGENLDQAEALGYPRTEKGCWMSLIDHEVLHLLVSEEFFKQISPVMQHESGLMSQPYDLRLFEESLVIAHQRVLRTYEGSILLKKLDAFYNVIDVLYKYKKLNIPYDSPASHGS